MLKQHQQLSWRRTLGMAIALGIFSAVKSPAQAMPVPTPDSLEIAQVGVRSRIDRPIPLNLRPRTHIPLPAGRYERRGSYYRYPPYRGDRHERYGYGHEHYHTHRHRRHERRRGPVIIINPSNYSEYSNYDGYIRVIRK